MPGLAAGLSAAPAHAGTLEQVLSDAQGMASEAGWAFVGWTQLLAVGDMTAIRAGAFALAGLVGLAGLYLLVRAPTALMLDADKVEEQEVAEQADAPQPAQADTGRPMRLLQAITAAKAQMAISEAERKHAR